MKKEGEENGSTSQQKGKANAPGYRGRKGSGPKKTCSHDCVKAERRGNDASRRERKKKEREAQNFAVSLGSEK